VIRVETLIDEHGGQLGSPQILQHAPADAAKSAHNHWTIHVA
jgi:hypothetical protein